MKCLVCGKRAYSDKCYKHKDRTPIVTRKPLPKATKPIKKQGKVAKTWLKTRQEWFKQNPAEGYSCYLCFQWLPKNQTQLDHVIPRSARPDLRNDLNNLMPVCNTCNILKGSKH